jgi:3-hydroxybutyryl-CoA dehydrogenase
MRVACLGAGRMGRGIAVVFAFAGYDVMLLDMKPRDEFEQFSDAVSREITATLAMMARIGLMQDVHIATIAKRVSVVPFARTTELHTADVIFEGVPEILDVKLDALASASRLANPDAIIASTTSTMLVDQLAPAVEHPRRFLNAHWLNPAYLVPLVELSPAAQTDPGVTATLKGLLEQIGKVPIVCAAAPGYIVPRIQALAMNEAARLVEQGVASAEDIDKAVKFGFGFRFAVLGLLEFIDWGGGDILYYASMYLADALDDPRYAPPSIIERNMAEGRIGMKTAQGFLNYEGIDLDAYREQRLAAFALLLRQSGLARDPVV